MALLGLPAGCFVPNPEYDGAVRPGPNHTSVSSDGSSGNEGSAGPVTSSTGTSGGGATSASGGLTSAGSTSAGSTSGGSFGSTSGGTDSGGDPWGPVECTRRIRLGFDNAAVVQALTDFPVLVVADASVLDYGDTQNDGSDIRFLDADGSSPLPHEIEQWDESGQSFVWVRVSELAAAPVEDWFWLYYACVGGSVQAPTEVWDRVYDGVWHLTPSLVDSSSGVNGGSNSGAADGEGSVAGGQAFDGMGSYIDLGDRDELKFARSVSVWARYNGLGGGTGNNLMVSAGGPNETAADNYQYTLNVEDDRRLHMYWEYGAGANYDVLYSSTAASVSSNAWHFYVFVRDEIGSDVRFFVDGVALGDPISYASPPAGGDGATTWLGAAQSGSSQWSFYGNLDEVRFASGRLTPAWIRADYLSVTNALLTYGPVEQAGP